MPEDSGFTLASAMYNDRRLEDKVVQSNKCHNYCVELINVCASWVGKHQGILTFYYFLNFHISIYRLYIFTFKDGERDNLKMMNIGIKHGNLVMVIGTVGCGKVRYSIHIEPW